MEIQKTQKVKASQKILSFIRNEREKGKETYIIHRSDRGMKEIPAKPPSEFDKKMEKTRMSDGILEEDEIEDLDKVYEQVKRFIEKKHGTAFKPSVEDVKRFMDAYLSEKNKKVNKNAFNSYLNCKKIREEYMKSKIEKRQEKKRMRELAMQGIIVKEIKPEVELNERDQKILNYFHQPYMQRPNSVNVNLRISQYNKKKVDINKECQILQKECNEMIKDQLVNGNKSVIQGLSNTNESFFMNTPIAANRAQTASSAINGRSASRNNNRGKKGETVKFANSYNIYSDMENETYSIDEEKQSEKKSKRIRFEGSLDLSPYNMAEKCQIDLRSNDLNLSALHSSNKNGISNNINISLSNHFAGKRDNLVSSQSKTRKDNLHVTRDAFYTPNQFKQRNTFDESYNDVGGTFITSQTHKKSNLKKPIRHDLSYQGSEDENNVSQIEDKFIRKTMISMVTGKPIRPYLQLQSLADKIEMRGKERKQKERIKILDDNKLKTMDEFRNFNFSGDQKNIPSTHTNIISSYINNNQISNTQNQTSNGNGGQSSSLSNNNQNGNGSSKMQQRKSILNTMSNGVSKNTTARHSFIAQTIQQSKEKKKSIFTNENTITTPSNQQTETINRQNKNTNKSQAASSNGNTPNNAKETKKRSVSTFEANKSLGLGKQDNTIFENNDQLVSSQIGYREQRYESSTKYSSNRNNLSNEKKNTTNIFSVNQRLGKYQKLVEKINHLRTNQNFKPSYWEEMKLLDDEIEREKDTEIKNELRRRQQQLGRRQFQALKQKEDEEEEIKAQKFEKLIQRTQFYENKLISQFEDIKKTKQRKNEEFKALIETLNRDRPMTREIRMKNYNLNSRLQSSQRQNQENKDKEEDTNKNLSLNHLREKAEDERKKILEGNYKEVEWYQQSVNKLAQLASNEEDMSICHLIMDQIKQILEDGIQLSFPHLQNVLNIIEENPKLSYNSNSLYCVELALSLFFIHLTDLSSFTKLQEAYQKKQNQREKSHKTDASSTLQTSVIKPDQSS